MRITNQALAGRCARALLSFFRSRAERRLSDSELRARREEVNRELRELGDEAFTDALRSLYALAEADARRKARDLASASRQQRLY